MTARLEQAVRHDPLFSELVDRLDSARMEVEEVARDLERYGAELSLEPRVLAEAEERLQAVRRLIRKHGHSLDDLIEWGTAARELQQLGAGEARSSRWRPRWRLCGSVRARRPLPCLNTGTRRQNSWRRP